MSKNMKDLVEQLWCGVNITPDLISGMDRKTVDNLIEQIKLYELLILEMNEIFPIRTRQSPHIVTNTFRGLDDSAVCIEEFLGVNRTEASRPYIDNTITINTTTHLNNQRTPSKYTMRLILDILDRNELMDKCDFVIFDRTCYPQMFETREDIRKKSENIDMIKVGGYQTPIWLKAGIRTGEWVVSLRFENIHPDNSNCASLITFLLAIVGTHLCIWNGYYFAGVRSNPLFAKGQDIALYKEAEELNLVIHDLVSEPHSNRAFLDLCTNRLTEIEYVLSVK